MLGSSSVIALAAALAYMPDDGTQGYTPYFYKMDVPVRVRNTISYGRAWQMLRSRGANSTAEGPCDPPQRYHSCNCSRSPPNPGLADDYDISAMPRCEPSSLCGVKAVASPVQADAVILLFMDMQRVNMRFPIGTCTACLRRGYGKAVRELLRILIALRSINTTLPIRILASGERYPEVEASIAARFSVEYVDTSALPPVPSVPLWASKWARGSFAKLRALALSQVSMHTNLVTLPCAALCSLTNLEALSSDGMLRLAQYRKLIVLDNDDVPLRNIDHLADAPSPAFVFGWKCFPRRELRASTMILTPTPGDWQRAPQLLQSEATGVHAMGSPRATAGRASMRLTHMPPRRHARTSHRPSLPPAQSPTGSRADARAMHAHSCVRRPRRAERLAAAVQLCVRASCRVWGDAHGRPTCRRLA